MRCHPPGSAAIEVADQSEFLRRALGDHVHESLITNKRIEWDRYRAAVTDYEINRYLPVL
jgi:glutamine synthetase